MSGSTYAARGFICGLLVGGAAAALIATMDRERFMRRLRSKAKAGRDAVAETARSAMDSAQETAEDLAGRARKQMRAQAARASEAAHNAMPHVS